MDYLLFYVVLMPLSWLPLWLLYRAADLLAPFMYHVLRYRRKVVDTNLQRSLPNLTEHQRRQVAHQYYRHMADLLVEALYNLRATPTQILKHYHIVNREVVDQFYEQGQSVILMSAHYNNWEYMVSSLGFQLHHHGVGVGKPLTDKTFGRLLNAKRTRYGTEVVDQYNVRQTTAYYDRYQVPTAYMMLGDQSPSNPHKSYWTMFLHQETPFLYGSEYFARKYNYPVLFYTVRKTRRGYYDIAFEPLALSPKSLPAGEITERYAVRLQQLIEQVPQYWLWSHRRWKKTRPADMPLRTTLPSTKPQHTSP